MANPFVPFGTAHMTVIALAMLVPLALANLVRRDPRHRARVRWGFAIAFGLGWVFWIALLDTRGWMGWGNALPMHLCDWANIAILATLLRPNQKTYDVAYFWTLGGTLPALLMPALAYGFPDARFLVFMGFHATIIASLLFITFGMGYRPYPSSIRRTAIWSFVWVGVASLVNWALGANYGFLAAKPAEHTPFDWFSPWPWYLPELAAVGAALLFVCYAPWFVWDLWRKAKFQPAASGGTIER